MGNFIAAVSPQAPGNWQICKREGLWGVIERWGSATGVANARRVAVGDYIFIWLGKQGRSPGGVIAKTQALGPFDPVRPGVRIPWPNPDHYAGVIPIRVISELDSPVGDSFTLPGRVGRRFGLSNMALIHGFREIDAAVATRLDEVLPGGASRGQA
jgi:hypothetical protein